jgi:hypothetical protein
VVCELSWKDVCQCCGCEIKREASRMNEFPCSIVLVLLQVLVDSTFIGSLSTRIARDAGEPAAIRYPKHLAVCLSSTLPIPDKTNLLQRDVKKSSDGYPVCVAGFHTVEACDLAMSKLGNWRVNREWRQSRPKTSVWQLGAATARVTTSMINSSTFNMSRYRRSESHTSFESPTTRRLPKSRKSHGSTVEPGKSPLATEKTASTLPPSTSQRHPWPSARGRRRWRQEDEPRQK